MRFRDGNGPLTSAHAVALTDAWPPTPLQKLSTPVPLCHRDLESGNGNPTGAAVRPAAQHGLAVVRSRNPPRP